MYRNDNRTVITLDAGGTNFVFSAMRGYDFIVPPITYPSNSHDLALCLETMLKGFREVMSKLDEKPVAVSFAFPGPADYRRGIIGGFLPNFPSFRDGVALGPYLERELRLPVYINNDGDLFTLGEAMGGVLPEINRKVRDLGGNAQFANLLGYTFGTGFGIGSVINGDLNLGNNCCIETFCLPGKGMPGVIAEEGVAIRAIKREYARLTGVKETSLEPYDIFKIAEGQREGDADAAKEAFAIFGREAGNSIAIAVSLTDSLVVLGGGLCGASKYFMPALLDEMRSTLVTIDGQQVPRVQMRVFDLDNELEFAKFVVGDARPLKIFGSDEEVIYNPMKRTGVIPSKLGASKAISIGAYTFALRKIDAEGAKTAASAV